MTLQGVRLYMHRRAMLRRGYCLISVAAFGAEVAEPGVGAAGMEVGGVGFVGVGFAFEGYVAVGAVGVAVLEKAQEPFQKV